MGTVRLISFGHWYYDHASTMMPVLTTEDGRRSDWGKVEQAIAAGDEVVLRRATPEEHERMLARFDETIDRYAAKGFVSGLGNFDPAYMPPDVVSDAVARIKREAREYARERSR